MKLFQYSVGLKKKSSKKIASTSDFKVIFWNWTKKCSVRNPKI